MTRSFIIYLMYHELELPERPVCRFESGYTRYVLRERDFREQMEYLKTAGFKGRSVGEALTFPQGSNIALTFDDGSETDLIAVAPILQQVGFGATFYITAGWLETRGYLSTSQLRELNAQGFEIGCHSMTHAFVPDLDEAGLKREIGEAKTNLEQIVGSPVEHFSCPGGRYNHRVASVARLAGYRTVATSRIQANSPDTDVFALGRVPILRDLPIEDFARICSGEALRQLRAQSAVRNAMKHLLGNSFYDRVRGILLGDRRA